MYKEIKVVMRISIRWLVVGAVLPVALLASCNRENVHSPRKSAWNVSLPGRHIYGEKLGLTVVNGLIYCLVGSERFDQCNQVATLCAIDSQSGDTRWTDQVETQCFKGRRYPLIAVGGGIVCYRTRSGALRALDAETGIERWQFPNPFSVLDISGNNVHILDSTGRYVILDTASGVIRETTTIRGNEFTDLLVIDGQRYLLNEKQLVATDSQTGHFLWQYKPQDEIAFGMRSAAGDLYVAEPRRVTAFDGMTGRIKWQKEGLGVLPVRDREFVYLGGEHSEHAGAKLNRLDALTGDHINTISVDLWYGYEPVVREGIIYSPAKRPHFSDFASASEAHGADEAGSSEYGIKATDAAAAAEIWSTSLTWGEYGTKPVVDNRFIYFAVAGADWSNSTRLVAYALDTKN